MSGREHAMLMATRHDHQRAVDVRHFVEEHGDIHRARFRHAVIAMPGAEILVPLPNLAVEGGFRVDLVLMHVELLAEQLFDRADQPRMGAKQTEGLVVGVRGERSTRRAGFFAPYLRPVGIINRYGFLPQGSNLLGGEAIGEEEIAFFVKLADLFFGQAHGFLPSCALAG